MSKFNFNNAIQLLCVYRDEGLLLYGYIGILLSIPILTCVILGTTKLVVNQCGLGTYTCIS